MARALDEDAVRAQMKDEIRRRRRALRRALPGQARLARSNAIGRRVTDLAEWPAARTVLAFVSMRTEVQTSWVVARAWSQSKRVGATRLRERDGELSLHRWDEGDVLEPSGMMFRQPTLDAAPIAEDDVDLVLVPALAVDHRGHRIGFGRGFYDRLLPRLSRALRVALVFDFERIAEVPIRPGDEPVDVVVTDERTIRTGAR